ncbi:hypothetical protein ACOMHN_027755 [Nucella lapillus]
MDSGTYSASGSDRLVSGRTRSGCSVAQTTSRSWRPASEPTPWIGPILSSSCSAPDIVTVMKARIRMYPLDRPHIAIFSQTFPVGLNHSRDESVDHTISGFPTFRLQNNITNTSLAYLTFGGYMMGDRSKTYGRWTPQTADIRRGLDGSGPLVVYDSQGGVVVVSPMDHSMASSVWRTDDVLAWGGHGGSGLRPCQLHAADLGVYRGLGND